MKGDIRNIEESASDDRSKLESSIDDLKKANRKERHWQTELDEGRGTHHF